MDSVEKYLRKSIKHEQDFDSLSVWIKYEKALILKRMIVLSRSMSVNAISVFKYPDVANLLSTIHDKYIFVSTDKALLKTMIVIYLPCTGFQNSTRIQLRFLA